MHYREHAPPPELAPVVGCFWEITGAAGSQRILPDGAMDVLFAKGDTFARVIGPMTRAIVTPAEVSADADGWVAGVRFKPGAALELLGVAARELRDDAVDASSVWGAAGRVLGTKLAETRDPRGALAVIASELASRMARVSAPDARVARAVEALRAARGELPVPAVAANVGLSERQLERLFGERVGYGPKAFARVVRLQRAVENLASATTVRGTIASWARFARDCGYGDQAHLIREFRALTGVTPVAYAEGRVSAVSEIDNTTPAPVASLPA